MGISFALETITSVSTQKETCEFVSSPFFLPFSFPLLYSPSRFSFSPFNLSLFFPFLPFSSLFFPFLPFSPLPQTNFLGASKQLSSRSNLEFRSVDKKGEEGEQPKREFGKARVTGSPGMTRQMRVSGGMEGRILCFFLILLLDWR